MIRKIILTALVMSMLFLSGCCMEHSWQDASCEKPKTCEKCGKTEGEVLGHDWEEVTCDKPHTCSRCGAQEGEALGHTMGEWAGIKTDLVSGCIRYERICRVCQDYTQSKEEPLDKLWENGIFLLSPIQMNDRMEFVLDRLSNKPLAAVRPYIEGKNFYTNISSEYILYAFLSYADEDGQWLQTDKMNAQEVGYVYACVDWKNGREFAPELLTALYMMFFPAADEADARIQTEEMLQKGDAAEVSSGNWGEVHYDISPNQMQPSAIDIRLKIQ